MDARDQLDILYAYSWRELYNYVRPEVQDRQTAEDLVAEAFYRAVSVFVKAKGYQLLTEKGTSLQVITEPC
jgi:DNA-directed RNA polymerase specialized sigma24 family protein